MDDLFELKIFNYLISVLGTLGYANDKVYFGYENGVQAIDDHVVLSVSGVDEDDSPEVRYRYEDNISFTIDEQIIYRGRVTVSIDLWGDNVIRNARRLKTLLHSSTQIELAQVLKLGFVGYSTTRSVPVVLENKYSHRAVFDLILNYSEAEIIPMVTIGKVAIIGADSSGNPLVNIEVEEPNYIP